MKVLLSLKPAFAKEILAGNKRFEFRRRIFKNEKAVVVVIYATKPIGMVVGEFKIKKIHVGHPEDLWVLASGHAGISHAAYSKYFQGKERGYAIEVRDVTTYRRPQAISEVIPGGRAPQSFAYIRGSQNHAKKRETRRKDTRRSNVRKERELRGDMSK